MWGKGDTVVPPLPNVPGDPTKTVQTNDEFDDDDYEGEEENYYNTARNVTEKWSEVNGCMGGRIPLQGTSGKAWDSGPYSIPFYGDGILYYTCHAMQFYIVYYCTRFRILNSIVYSLRPVGNTSCALAF
jgi:hypothetical protein